uniref:Uncharacterized protein n=1 Tax=Knipowitschia caucasica TaxID=637954 RepID=A0AAV2KRR8_KNICA
MRHRGGGVPADGPLQVTPLSRVMRPQSLGPGGAGEDSGEGQCSSRADCGELGSHLLLGTSRHPAGGGSGVARDLVRMRRIGGAAQPCHPAALDLERAEDAKNTGTPSIAADVVKVLECGQDHYGVGYVAAGGCCRDVGLGEGGTGDEELMVGVWFLGAVLVLRRPLVLLCGETELWQHGQLLEFPETHPGFRFDGLRPEPRQGAA